MNLFSFMQNSVEHTPHTFFLSHYKLQDIIHIFHPLYHIMAATSFELQPYSHTHTAHTDTDTLTHSQSYSINPYFIKV